MTFPSRVPFLLTHSATVICPQKVGLRSNGIAITFLLDSCSFIVDEIALLFGAFPPCNFERSRFRFKFSTRFAFGTMLRCCCWRRRRCSFSVLPFRGETSSKPLRLLNASGVPRFEEVKHKTSRKKRIFCCILFYFCCFFTSFFLSSNHQSEKKVDQRKKGDDASSPFYKHPRSKDRRASPRAHTRERIRSFSKKIVHSSLRRISSNEEEKPYIY